MRASIGYLAIAAGFAACLLGGISLVIGVVRSRPRFVAVGPRYAYVAFIAALLACVAMEWALFARDFSIQYVADNVARATPGLFTFTALWGALEGSILLWTLILCGYLVYLVRKFRTRADDGVVIWATVTAFAVTLFFFALMLITANPFASVEGLAPLDGNGPNPLLQNHILMAFHPPVLYLGYVGMTIPFCFAIGALVTGRVGESWLQDVRRSTLIAWGALTVGIVLGAWWSYEVLGWGGYWGWDPVENASFMPWLTATAFLHSLMVQERRAMLRVWNLSLVIATFSLTILGTFLTRSGVIDSVHAFSESHIGPWLLSLFAGSIIVGIGLIAWRGEALRAPGRIDSPLSREGTFLANNLLFAGFAFVVLAGTVYPLLVEALQDRPVSVGAPYFNRMSVPIGIGLLFLMAIAPALPWRAASGELLRTRLLVPAYVGVGTMLVCVLLGARGLAEVTAFGLGAFCVAGIVRNYVVAVRSRHAHRGESYRVACFRQIRSNPRSYGGLVVHIGVVIIAVAIAASQGYTTRRQFDDVAKGETRSIRGYELTFREVVAEESDQKRSIKALIEVERNGRSLGTYAPAITRFGAMPTGIGTPSVRTGLREDLYLTFVRAEPDGSAISFGAAVNPLVLWLWVGGGVMLVGTMLALVPAKREQVRPDDEPRKPELVSA